MTGPLDVPFTVTRERSAMSPVVGWTARVLLAAWTRQEAEGRYRGADDFRALHIDPNDALASWRATIEPDAPWPAELADRFAGLTAGWALADCLELAPADVLVAAVAAAVELEPRLRPLVAALTDDPATRAPTVGLVAELAPAAGLDPADARCAARLDGRLATYDLVRAEPVAGRPSRLDELLVASDWLIGYCAGRVPAPPPTLRWTSGDAASVQSPGVPVLLRGADAVRHAEAFAAHAAIVPGDVDPAAIGALARDARMAGTALVVACAGDPPADLVAGSERLARLGSRIAISLAPAVRWVPPPNWPVRVITTLTSAERADRWRARLHPAVLPLSALAAVAADYRLGADGVDDAAERVRAGGDLSVAAVRAAARDTAWRDLSAVARPGPAGVGWSDLVVPQYVDRALREIVDAIGSRRTVLDEWGFGERPGGRGYHLLFAGPSGTGKTLGAAVVAAATGLELWVVDLARIVDKYLGETEKQLDRVLRTAEGAGAMLLFDEADALFGRRAEVREARDRWANVEVAYLLQRIEGHDGVTVLTTNVSHHLDEAFARRVSRRVEFPVPDARLRRELWHRSIPAQAPLVDHGDLDTVADRFELAGGAIRTAAVNAAFAAASDGGRIGLGHIVRATVGELTKAGHEPTRAELGDLAELVALR
jgi:ATPase family protein associated with various cellular activities (AAA)